MLYKNNHFWCFNLIYCKKLTFIHSSPWNIQHIKQFFRKLIMHTISKLTYIFLNYEHWEYTSSCIKYLIYVCIFLIYYFGRVWANLILSTLMTILIDVLFLKRNVEKGKNSFVTSIQKLLKHLVHLLVYCNIKPTT